jgi:hypothetical protein
MTPPLREGVTSVERGVHIIFTLHVLCMLVIPDNQQLLIGVFVGVSTKLAAARPAAKVRFTVDVEEVRARTQATEQDQQAPIKMVTKQDQ